MHASGAFGELMFPESVGAPSFYICVKVGGGVVWDRRGENVFAWWGGGCIKSRGRR